MTRIRKLRAFAGAPLPLPLQRVAEAAWSDEAHVTASRALYQQKFADADRVFAGLQGYRAPGGGFFLWLPVEDGEAATMKLWRETGVRVLPGAYLSRDVGGGEPRQGLYPRGTGCDARGNRARADKASRLHLRVRD